MVASAEGGAQVAVCVLRQRSESEARMFTHTVRSSGWCSLVLLKVLASCRCWSPPTSPADALTRAFWWLWAAAAVMTSAGMVRVC